VCKLIPALVVAGFLVVDRSKEPVVARPPVVAVRQRNWWGAGPLVVAVRPRGFGVSQRCFAGAGPLEVVVRPRWVGVVGPLDVAVRPRGFAVAGPFEVVAVRPRGFAEPLVLDYFIWWVFGLVGPFEVEDNVIEAHYLNTSTTGRWAYRFTLPSAFVTELPVETRRKRKNY